MSTITAASTRYTTRRRLKTRNGHECGTFRISTIYYVCDHNHPVRVADVLRGGGPR
jgi:hypothetical protein